MSKLGNMLYGTLVGITIGTVGGYAIGNLKGYEEGLIDGSEVTNQVTIQTIQEVVPEIVAITYKKALIDGYEAAKDGCKLDDLLKRLEKHSE